MVAKLDNTVVKPIKHKYLHADSHISFGDASRILSPSNVKGLYNHPHIRDR